jgi:undecaprenyl-diphosphatase
MSRREKRAHGLPFPFPSDVMTPLAVVIAVGVFALLGILAVAADHDLLPWDRPVRRAIRGIDGAWLHDVMRFFTSLGGRGVLALLLVPVVVIAWFRCRQIAIILLIAFPAAFGIEMLLKALVDRPRPATGGHFNTGSFPSGHVIAASAFWGLIPPWAYLVTRRRVVWLIAVIASGVILAGVGVSRVYLGAHWPSDVVAGYLGGSVFLLGAEWAVRRSWPALRCTACDFHPLLEPLLESRDDSSDAESAQEVHAGQSPRGD